MDLRDFANLADLLRRRSGLLLTPDKAALAQSRLGPVAQLFGFKDAAALLAELPYPSEELARAVTEAMMTNETSFFRDRAFFDSFSRSILPALLGARALRRRLRIWCAAVATGQEAYSLAMILDDAALAARGWKIDLTATDISAAAIARAEEGLYSAFEVQRGLSTRSLVRHFSREGESWRINDRLRRMIAFRTFNLLDDFGWLGEIDVIVCRNVLLYIEPLARAAILARLAATLADDGYLLLGSNEQASDHFVSATGGCGHYFKPRGAATRAALLAVF
ncbi:MAG: CheR family methyltransferase [Rhizomicrobium sp.]